MSETPRVSVIIATYNRAIFLAETIDSVLQQRFRDYELIVVDDGSTDQTRTLVESYRSRIRYLRECGKHLQSLTQDFSVRNLHELMAPCTKS